MKTYIKYFLLVLCVFIVSGCSNQSTGEVPIKTDDVIKSSEPSPTIMETTQPTADTTVNEIDAVFSIFWAETFKADDFKDYRNSWQFLIQQKFNIRIIVHDLTTYGKPWDHTTGETNLLAETGENVFSEILNHSETETIAAYNEYIRNSTVWNSLPESFRNTFTDTSGNIWAIPKSDKVSVLARAYNKNWLEALGMSIPGDTNELYEVLKAFTYGDPDGNGQADTYGTTITPRTTSLHSFKDVLEANGCRLTYTYNKAIRSGEDTVVYKAVPVGFNPNSGLIEDYSTSKSLKDSLTYIRGLIDEGIVNITSNSIPDGYFLKDEYGSQLGLLDENYMNTKNYSYTFSLNDMDDKNVSSIPRSDDGYFIYSRSKDKEKIIPPFIDIFYGIKEGYKTAFTGITGDNFKYKETEDGFVVNESFNKGVTHIDLLGELSWFDINVQRPYINSSLEAVNVDELLNDPRMFVLEPKQMSFMENLTAGYADGTGGSAKYEKDINKIYTEFYKGNISVDELVEETKKLNAIYEIESLINQTNERWLLGN